MVNEFHLHVHSLARDISAEELARVLQALADMLPGGGYVAYRAGELGSGRYVTTADVDEEVLPIDKSFPKPCQCEHNR